MPVGVFAVALAVALLLVQAGRLPFSADQAMVGLMANDIRAGARPVFFQGSEYAGTIESHAVALAFSLFGPSAAIQRSVVALSFASFAALLAAAAGIWFGRRAAALGAGLYAALGPAYLLYKGLTSDGHYGPVLVVGAALFLLLGLIVRQAERGSGFGPRLLFLGLLHGVGIWISPLCVSYVAPSAVVLLARPVRPALRARHLVLCLSGVLVGSLPWWLRNIETGFASLDVPGARLPDAATLAERWRSLLSEGLPVLLGTAAMETGKPSLGWSFALAVCVASIVFVIGAAGATTLAVDPATRTGLRASAALVLVSVGLALAVRGQDELPEIRMFREPRLLIPVYVGFAPIVGHAFTRLAKRRPLALGLGAALAVVHASGWAKMPRWKGFQSGETEAVLTVLEGLRSAGIHSVYSPYWAAYPITFFSRGQIVGSPFGSNSSVRRDDDRRKVEADPSPGFLLWPPDREQFDEYLRDSGFSFDRTELGSLTLFSGVDSRALPGLRACLCVPPIIRRDSISWRSVEGPKAVVQGDVAQYRVRFRNGGLSPWPPGVNVGYHWRARDGRDAEKNGLRTAVRPGPENGEEKELSVRVSADVPPGTYQLAFDLVIEWITWFEWKGIPPAVLTVEVVAREGASPNPLLGARREAGR